MKKQSADECRPADGDRCGFGVRPDYRSEYKVLPDHGPAAIDSRMRRLSLRSKRGKQHQ